MQGVCRYVTSAERTELDCSAGGRFVAIGALGQSLVVSSVDVTFDVKDGRLLGLACEYSCRGPFPFLGCLELEVLCGKLGLPCVSRAQLVTRRFWLGLVRTCMAARSR